ncbi:MAG: hypothetical protein ACM3MG_00280 [Bacillota bacterium]
MPFKIIYLDDESDLLEVFSDAFSREDIEIKTFADIEPAVKEILADPPDLLFIDYRLKNGQTGDKISMRLNPLLPKALITGELSLEISEPIFKKIFRKPYIIDEIENFIQEVKKQKAV